MTDQRILNRRARMGQPAVTGPKMVRGKPIVTPATRHFKDTRDFQDQLIAVRADRTKTTRERKAAEAQLVARRRHQLGEG